jgi:hypothetical protein
MPSSPAHEIALRELEMYPRGPRGSDQNLFRAAFYDRVMNCIGRRPQVESVDAARELAISAVREFSPGFEPTTAV